MSQIEHTTEGRVKGLHYRLSGQGTSSLVLLPSLGTTIEMWQPQTEFLYHDYQVILCDTGGYFPDESSSRSLKDRAESVLAVLDDLEIEEADVGGISMGGMIGQELAILAPQRIRSLVLASSTASYPPQSRQQLRHRAEVARNEGMEALIQPTLDRWFTPEFTRANHDVVDWIGEMLRWADPEAYATAADAVADVDTSERLGNIHAPTLVLAAEYDSSMPPMAAEMLAERIATAELALVPDSAHLSNLGNPNEFNRLLASFLRRVESQISARV